MRYLLKLGYKGTSYHGWQIQENAHTVQAELENAINTILQSNIHLTGCGRTDTGVHAREYFAHFDFNSEIPDNFIFKLNSILPKDIVSYHLSNVKDTFSARFDAIHREYKYYLHWQKNPFLEEFSWYQYGLPDIDAMNNLEKHLVGEKNFMCFCKGQAPGGNYLCKVFFASWIQTENQLIFTINANRFLRNMVRAIVGTMLEVGYGRVTENEFISILENGTRSDAGQSVPAHGLFLVKVSYL
jgi:tRNA pseudouridine38-40 synthase